MEKVIVRRIAGLPVFCRMSKAGQNLSFGPEPQGNNRQKKAWGVWYIWRGLQ